MAILEQNKSILECAHDIDERYYLILVWSEICLFVIKFSEMNFRRTQQQNTFTFFPDRTQ